MKAAHYYSNKDLGVVASETKVEAETAFVPAKTATVVEVVGKVITLRDNVTGGTVNATQTANRVSKVEGQ